MPTLAICRGFQLLNVARGGDLVQHLPEEVGHDVHKQVPGRVRGASGRGQGGLAARGDRRRRLRRDVAPPSGARARRRGPRRDGVGRGRHARGRRGSVARASPSASSGTRRPGRTRRSSRRSSSRRASTAPAARSRLAPARRLQEERVYFAFAVIYVVLVRRLHRRRAAAARDALSGVGKALWILALALRSGVRLGRLRLLAHAAEPRRC